MCPTQQARLVSTSTHNHDISPAVFPCFHTPSDAAVTAQKCHGPPPPPADLSSLLALGAEAAHQLSCHGSTIVPAVALQALEGGGRHFIVEAVGEVAQDTDSILHTLGKEMGHEGWKSVLVSWHTLQGTVPWAPCSESHPPPLTVLHYTQ